MGEIIRFVPKSERERARLIGEARAIYDRIFPPADPVSKQQDKAPVSHTVSGVMPDGRAAARRVDEAASRRAPCGMALRDRQTGRQGSLG